MTDFFISYTGADGEWAEWIAWVLEEAGYSVVLQAWDFGPGSNFVIEMQHAAEEAERLIAVLSPDYPKSKFAAPEWAAVFSRDPDAAKRLLIPVKVKPCAVDGMFKPLVYIDLVDADIGTAKKRLLEGVRKGRSKPKQAPSFPGRAISAKAGAPASFPGIAPARSAPPARSAMGYMPTVHREFTDLDKSRFLKAAFQYMQSYFQNGVAALHDEYPDIDGDVTVVDAMKFIAEVFVGGTSRCWCKIWMGGMFGGNSIAFSEGTHHGLDDNSMNESMSVQDGGPSLALKAMLSFSSGLSSRLDMDPEHLTPEQAAEYLWRRFVSPLERR